MLSVIMLNAMLLHVVMLNVVLLSVVMLMSFVLRVANKPFMLKFVMLYVIQAECRLC